MNKYTSMKYWLKYSMTLYTVGLMCIFFVIVGADQLNSAPKGTTVLGSVLNLDSLLTLFGIMTASFFGLAMFENNGKLTGFWGLVSSILTTVVFLKLKLWIMLVLYIYNDVTNLWLTIKGGNEEKQPEVKSTIIQISIVFVIALALQIYQSAGVKIDTTLILSILSFVLTGIGQTLLIKQTRWQFAAWVPKNGFELVLGLIQGNPVVICRNVFFLFMNVFSYTNWILSDKEAKENELLEA